ncbi:MAG: hypothetical protein ACD_57C00212G0003 [uncultured bacterium]|uniref:Uncharacterized protein n=1 Tax=Candidatus Woesebacteria bacterium RIFCSPLOWO2_01_FULL_39_21 TaxID=1802519 RepID=A0A1F8BCM2_9BACT|nr:MAG: hypothetical protein ACD_57C00212G0003 [uncultured bacterium]OGM23428.1 MAG: hypothetical protein A2691_01555 [Candidatus Woesebacteria bacterium RIFCSPHIGHO2_01_FULL_39_23]OGM61792.1 MAG: hypothetical protein A2961_02540 [Candidatus Woesebacteria bacterium RIFCSPLOWO2_01_FULL_39_21]
MATISTFKCRKCGKEFNLIAGLLNRDLVEVTKGTDLPGDAKLPDKKNFTKIARQKTTDHTFNFNNDLMNHQKSCDGDVNLISVVYAH